ncbi:uncharacterized protein LOC135962418 [Calliphora vicina]|uniref:uncharacterized protein LOC135962418 n=1 Tax=Calliphora vicina TaxID=7373 RepID=UPI00325A6D16
MEKIEQEFHMSSSFFIHEYPESFMCLINKMLLKVENTLLRSHRQRETTGIKKLYNSFFVLF